MCFLDGDAVWSGFVDRRVASEVGVDGFFRIDFGLIERVHQGLRLASNIFSFIFPISDCDAVVPHPRAKR
jgi:hypothetical protein